MVSIVVGMWSSGVAMWLVINMVGMCSMWGGYVVDEVIHNVMGNRLLLEEAKKRGQRYMILRFFTIHWQPYLYLACLL